MKRMRNLKGFTLIELIVVILILGILAAIAVVGYSNITAKANVTALQANGTQIAKALSVDATLGEKGSVTLSLGAEAAANTSLDTRFAGVDVAYVAANEEVTVTGKGVSGTYVIDTSGEIAQGALVAYVAP